MNLFVRCFLVWFGTLFKKKLHSLDVSVLSFRVLPNDLDVYWHMNNGRFLTIMDLGRIDLLLRSDLGKNALKHKWNPIIASSMMRYRRPLKVFERYQLKTRIVGWDERWFFIEQLFEKDGQLMAAGYVKGLFVSKKGSVPTAKVLEKFDLKSPEIPEQILKWQKSDYWTRPFV